MGIFYVFTHLDTYILTDIPSLKPYHKDHRQKNLYVCIWVCTYVNMYTIYIYTSSSYY